MIATATPQSLEAEFLVDDSSGATESDAASSKILNAIENGIYALRQGSSDRKRLVVKVSVSNDSKTSRRDKDEDGKIDDFLETVYVLVKSDETRRAIDWVFQRMNELLNRGSFRLCDRILARVDVDQLNSTLMVGLLSITLAAKEFLCFRAGLYGEIFNKLSGERGPEATARLLNKYK